MRRLGVLSLAGFLSGCSWLYDSGKLPEQMPDAAIDGALNPCNLKLLSASPAELHEGQGDGGGRPALLVIEGESIAANATVTVTPTDAGVVAKLEKYKEANEEVRPVVSGGGAFVALQLVAAVDPALAAGASIDLTVTVTQECNGAMTVVTMPAMVKLRGYAELTANPPGGLSTAGPNRYSKVEMTVAPAYATPASGPLIIRSNSSIQIDAPISVNAATATPGPGGAAGGGPGAAGAGPGRGSGGPSSGGKGGPAGYSVAAAGAGGGPQAGDPLITSFATNQGSGGGGGVAILTLPGGAAGAGGGTVELTAQGTVKLMSISATGGDGAGSGTTAGGGGSGGTIVVRGSIVTSTGELEVKPGGMPGNPGAPGRIRIDSETRTVPAATLAVARRGGTFPASFPMVVRDDRTELSFNLLGSTAARVDVRVVDRDNQASSPVSIDFQSAEEARARVTLKNGYNRICALPQGSSISSAESTNCVEVAYIKP